MDRAPESRERGRAAKLVGHSVLYGSAGVLGKAAALLTVPYLTRELGPAGYGLADLATSFAALLTLLVRFAGDFPAMRMAAPATATSRPTVLSSFVAATAGVSISAALALGPAAELISGGLWASPGNASLAVAALALVPLSAIQAALINVTRILERPRAFALLSIIDLLAQLALAVLFVVMGLGPVGVVLGFVAGSSVGLLAAVAMTWRHLTPAIDTRVAWQIIREGIPFLPGVAAFVLADTISRVLAANVLSVSAVGQLALAIRLASIMALVSYAFSMAWGPYGLSLQPSAATRNIFRSVLTLQVLVIGCVAVALGAVAPEVTVLLSGDAFVPSAAVIPGLLYSAGLAGPLYVMATAAGVTFRGRWVAWASLLGALLQVAAMGVSLAWFGLVGFAVASVAGRFITLVVLGHAVADIAPLGARAWAVLLAGLAGVLGIQALIAAGPESLWIRVAITGAALVIGLVGGSRLLPARRLPGLTGTAPEI